MDMNQFIKLDLIRGKNSQNEYEAYFREQNPDSKIDEYIGDHSDYKIEGYLWLLNSKPISSTALEHYLYLTSFFIFETIHTFYTRRSLLNSYLILYTYSGQGILKYQGQEYKLLPGDGFFINCMEPHEYSSDTSWKHVVIHFNGTPAVSAYQEFQKDECFLFHIRNENLLEEKLNHLLATYNTYSSHRDFLISAALMDLISLIIQQQENHTVIPECYQSVAKYIEQNYTRDLSLDTLASLAYVSKYHFAHEFKKYIGYSPKEYISVLRLSRAENLLLTTNISISKIGEISGLPNMPNFIRLFKNKNHCTPSAYRNKNKSMEHCKTDK